jgi:hypothetical protein
MPKHTIVSDDNRCLHFRFEPPHITLEVVPSDDPDLTLPEDPCELEDFLACSRGSELVRDPRGLLAGARVGACP